MTLPVFLERLKRLYGCPAQRKQADCRALSIPLFLWCLILPTLAFAGNAPDGLLCDLQEYPGEISNSSRVPAFGWVYHPSFRNDAQSAYHILVASSPGRASAGTPDVWDSGWISNAMSINVRYGGAPLPAEADFYWRVQTADSTGKPGPLSDMQHFITGSSSNSFDGCGPLRFVPASPVLLKSTGPGRWFADFGQDAFGYVTVRVSGRADSGMVKARFGEMADGLSVKTKPPPGSSILYSHTAFEILGEIRLIQFDRKGAGIPDEAVHPQGTGIVAPFRYFELENFPGKLTSDDLQQMRLVSDFNPKASSFTSSSDALNQVWTLCWNSMRFLNFDGLYVDGERERRPYEADAYIHQLTSYAVDRDYLTPRRSFVYLQHHPTWPTEWKFYEIFIAWADYLQTGDTNLLSQYYANLQADSFTWAATEGGLIKGFPHFPQTTNSDVIDWPPRDRDGFVIGRGGYLNWTNSVNNSLYYRGLRIMANIARALGRSGDAASDDNAADRVYNAFNASLWNSAAQCYVDGVGTLHASAHANFFPLACELVPQDRRTSVLNFLHGRIAANHGMPCSVYGAQSFLEALFETGDADTAIELMSTNGPRGWLNMLAMGSTLTTEAWNFTDKPNMDWNHAWGAAPGNLISRFVLGVRPITPGYGRIVIQPQLGSTLTWVQGVVPTIRGPISICASNTPPAFQLLLEIHGNVIATVQLPRCGATNTVASMDGSLVSGVLSNNCLVITNVGAGRHAIWLDKNSPAAYANLNANWAADWLGTNALDSSRLPANQTNIPRGFERVSSVKSP